ncbi:hypothetical protein [Streptomyces sp. NBC_01304]|uniref:hypothetical protein n=1 Tax=Streptomyces sp. NBC_01304 TaxID=2903818 RepID=UPI002E132806|nr:hypothetical protein OG430_44530 [Streptomyces sp. NBC_01304]
MSGKLQRYTVVGADWDCAAGYTALVVFEGLHEAVHLDADDEISGNVCHVEALDADRAIAVALAANGMD